MIFIELFILLLLVALVVFFIRPPKRSSGWSVKRFVLPQRISVSGRVFSNRPQPLGNKVSVSLSDGNVSALPSLL